MSAGPALATIRAVRLVELRIEAPWPLAEPRGDLRAVARVDHQAVAGQAALGQMDLVDQHVVEHAAGLVANERVAHLPGRHVVDAAGEHRIEKRGGVGAVDDQPAHVRDVEQPDGPPRGLVLVDDRPVLHGHRPAGEVDHPAAVGDVPVVQRRAVEFEVGSP